MGFDNLVRKSCGSMFNKNLFHPVLSVPVIYDVMMTPCGFLEKVQLFFLGWGGFFLSLSRLNYITAVCFPQLLIKMGFFSL